MASVSFPACGGYGIIRITDSDWYGWNIRGSSDYVKFYTTSGIGSSDVFYEIKPNCSTSSKSASFSLYDDDGYSMGVWSVSIAAKKTGDDQVTVTPTSLAMPLGAPETVSVETEGTWTLCTPIMDDAYAIYRNRCEIKVTGILIGSEYTGSRDFTVTYQEGNEMYVNRLNVRLACTNQNITVRQADYPTISNKTITVPAEGATIQIGPYNTGSWTASGFPYWITPSTTSGTTFARFTITVPPNISNGSRTGTFIITTGGTSYTFTVIQDNIDVSGPGTITFDNAGGSASGTITYELEPDTITHKVEGDWITLTNGTNAADFNVSVPAAGGIVSRSGNVISTLTFGDQFAVIITKVVQEGSNYRFTPATAEIPAEGGSVTIEVESDYPLDGYNSASSSFGTIDFIRVSNTKISIEYTRPLAASDINDTVVLNGDFGFNSISLTSITQPNGVIILEDTTLEFSVEGGTIQLGPYDTGFWSASGFPSWITPSTNSGTSYAKFEITVAPNISTTARTGEFTITTGGVTYTFTVTQSPIIAEWQSSLFVYAGNSGGDYGNSLTYNLKPDSIDFNTSYPWFEIISTNIYDNKSDVLIRIPSAGGSLMKEGNVVATLHYGNYELRLSSDVFQYGDNYTVDPSTTVISPEGGSVVVTVESDYTLNDYTSVTGVTTGTYNMERLSSNKIQITFDFGPNYGSPISMTPKLESSAYGTEPIPLTTITQDTFVFNWEFHTNDIYSTGSSPEYPNVDKVRGYIDYESSVVINDMTFTIEYLDGDGWINSITNQPDSDWKYVLVEAKDNRLGYTRRAKITARSERYEASREFVVYQLGLQLSVVPSRSTIRYEGGSVTVALEDLMTGWIGPNEFTLVLNGEEVPFTSEFKSRTLDVTIDIPENETVEERAFDYLIYVNNEVRSNFEVIQDPFALQWDFPTTPIHLGNEKSNFTIEFTSNADIENIIISNVPDWLTFTRNGNTIIGVASKNTGETRSVTLTFTADGFGVSKQLEVTQDAFVWTLDTTGLLFDCTSGTPENPTSNPISKTVTYTSSTPISNITASIQYLSGSDWLTVDYNGNIVVTAMDNRLGNYRNAIITLYPDDYSISQQIYVSQYGSSFEWDETTALLDAKGGQVTFTYTAIDGYLLLSDITVANVELSWSFNGGYNGSITFNVPMNTGIARVFNPKVYAGNRLIGEFTITQEDSDITVDTPEIIAPAEGEDVVVNITSDLPWFTEVVGDWISVKPNKGDSSSNIIITIAENPWNYVRTGYVYISNGIDRETIKITQVGSDPILYFTKNYIPVPLKGGIKYVRLVNNTYWTTEWEIQ